MLPRRLLLAAGCALAAATCKVYPDSLLDPRPGTTPPPAGSTGVGFWSGPGDGDCFSAHQPTDDLRPPEQSAPDGPVIYLAIEQLWLGAQRLDGTPDPEAWRDYGFDLDDSCTASATCDPERPTASCKRVQTTLAPDGNFCRDNNFGRFEFFVTSINDIGGRFGLNDDFFNCGLCYGRYNILIKITGYNGTLNDDKIRVDLYRSPGLETSIPLDCKTAAASRLCWLSEAPWTIDRASLTAPASGAELPPADIFDEKAFVRDGYLVGHFPEKALIWFPGTSEGHTTFPLQITRGLVSARLGKSEEGTWSITDGVIGGRVLADDVIQGFRRVGLCEGDKLYPTVQSYVKANLDIGSDPSASPDAPCDAISLGVLFTARQATAGKVVDGPKLTDCPPIGGAGGGGSGGGAGSGG